MAQLCAALRGENEKRRIAVGQIFRDSNFASHIIAGGEPGRLGVWDAVEMHTTGTELIFDVTPASLRIPNSLLTHT